jgi:hypothetical protein
MANSSSRNGARVLWVTVHTAEGIRKASDLKAFFDRSTSSSAHAVADDFTLLDYLVPYDRASWTLRSGNGRSDNLELCGFAAWTRDEWVNNHQGMLSNAAAWIRSRCLARGIPIRKLSSVQVAAGANGVIGHVDYTNGTGDGTHWDPGPGFPWDIVIARAAGASPNPAPEPEPAQTGVELMERITVTPPNAGSNPVRVFLSGTAGAGVVIRPHLDGKGVSKPLWVGDIFAWGNDKQGVGQNPTQVAGYNSRLTSHRRYSLAGAVWADINYSASEPFEIDCF